MNRREALRRMSAAGVAATVPVGLIGPTDREPLRLDMRESDSWDDETIDLCFNRIDRITLNGEKVEVVAADERAGVVVKWLTRSDPEWNEARHARSDADHYVARYGVVRIHLLAG
jgi:hypothetical protein